jgi:hypothetical protein
MVTIRCFTLLGFLAGSSLAAAVAHAAGADCGKWETAFTSLAGEGEALNTSFCSAAGGQEYSFEITCSSGSLNLRFMPLFGGDGLTLDKVTVDYAIDGKSHAVETQFEELDGAFAADIATTDPLIAAMKAGRSAIVTLKDIKAPAYTVPLAGFTRAISKLIRNCS